MKSKLFVIAAVIPLLLVLLVPTFADVGRGESMNKFDGEWRYMPQTMEELTTNGNGSLFHLSTDSADWIGTFEGSSDDDCVSVLHASGRWFGYCTASFSSVTINGKTGGLELGLSFVKTSPVEPWVGEWVITAGTGDLEDLQGEGTLWGHGYNPDKPNEPGVIYYKVKKLKSRNFDD